MASRLAIQFKIAIFSIIDGVQDHIDVIQGYSPDTDYSCQRWTLVPWRHICACMHPTLDHPLLIEHHRRRCSCGASVMSFHALWFMQTVSHPRLTYPAQEADEASLSKPEARHSGSFSRGSKYERPHPLIRRFCNRFALSNCEQTIDDRLDSLIPKWMTLRILPPETEV